MAVIKKSKYTLTSNEYYGGLNKRFDKRTDLLKTMNLRYNKDVVGYMRAYNTQIDGKRKWYFQDGDVKMRRFISNSAILYADNRAFVDLLKPFSNVNRKY